MRRLLPLCLVLLVAGVLPASRGGAQQQLAAAPGITVFNPENRHHYQVVRAPDRLDWPKAAAAAAGWSFGGARGHLAAINNAAEQNFIWSNLMAHNSWFGAYQDRRAPDFKEPAGGWRWVTGEPWGFSFWREGEPNDGDKEEAAVLWDGGRWSDVGAPHPVNTYLVEYPTTGAVTNPPLSTTEQIEDLLTRIQKQYTRVRTYSATVQFSSKLHIDKLGALNAQLYFQRPASFRLEGRGNNGSLVAVSNGRIFVMARTTPGERMQYMVKPARGLVSLEEAMSLLIESPLPPSLTGFVLGAVPPRLWSTAGKVGGVEDTAPNIQQLQSSVKMTLIGENPIDADAYLMVSTEEQRILSSEIAYRYKAYPFSAKEVHNNVRLNEAIPPAAFTFVPNPGAIQVDDLGERTDEVSYAPGRRP
jgi:hypothetical protein